MIHILPKIAVSLLLLSLVVRSEEKIAVRTLALRADEMPVLFIHTGTEYLSLDFSAVQPGEIAMALTANPLPLYPSTPLPQRSRWRQQGRLCHRASCETPATGRRDSVAELEGC